MRAGEVANCEIAVGCGRLNCLSKEKVHALYERCAISHLTFDYGVWESECHCRTCHIVGGLGSGPSPTTRALALLEYDTLLVVSAPLQFGLANYRL